MEKTLIKVGNSRAIVLPNHMVDKYHLDKVTIQEVEEGILIKPASSSQSFQAKLAQLKRNKQQIYKQIKIEAEDPETIAFYEHETLPDVDL